MAAVVDPELWCRGARSPGGGPGGDFGLRLWLAASSERTKRGARSEATRSEERARFGGPRGTGSTPGTLSRSAPREPSLSPRRCEARGTQRACAGAVASVWQPSRDLRTSFAPSAEGRTAGQSTLARTATKECAVAASAPAFGATGSNATSAARSTSGTARVVDPEGGRHKALGRPGLLETWRRASALLDAEP